MRILIFILLLFPTVLFSAVDTSGLTAEQKAKIQLEIEKLKKATPEATAENLKEYAELGEAIAKALGSCAREMGVAVNEFSDTKVGTLATLLIIWKVAGEDVFKYALGIGFFILTFGVWVHFFRRVCCIESKTYHENGKLKEISYANSRYDEPALIGWAFVLACLIGISCLIMFVGG